MADHTDEEVADDSPYEQPENTSSNIKRDYNSDVPHKPKQWREYFFEFLMIFFAVTLGFIAENLRGYLKDREKEKQYVEGFIRNLKDDAAGIQHVIKSDRLQVKGIDSLPMLSHADMTIDSNRRSFYHYVIKYCYNSSSFKSNDATLQQLKSTGDLRLIEKDHVADSLTKYDSEIHNVYKQGDYYESYFKEILSRLDELADMTVIGDTSFIREGKIMNRPFPPLRAQDGELMTFFNKLVIFKIITNAYVENYLEPQLRTSERLIEFLQNKYDIED